MDRCVLIWLTATAGAAVLTGASGCAPPAVAAPAELAASPEPAVLPPPHVLPELQVHYHQRCTILEEQDIAEARWQSAEIGLRQILAELDDRRRRMNGFEDGWEDSFRERVLFWLGWVLHRSGHRAEAVREYRQLLEAFPDSRWVPAARVQLRALRADPGQ